jgi:2-C-methyl-D-erythritol 2,4-cyclodiphosphate synthase
LEKTIPGDISWDGRAEKDMPHGRAGSRTRSPWRVVECSPCSELAERERALLDNEKGRRVGIGHDIHRLVADRRLVLGGVDVPAEKGFDTPSDGDVLCHALIDALAGALVDGDLGRFFPADDDPAAQGARSIDFLRAMGAHVSSCGFAVEHVDAYLTLGTTRLGPHLDSMRVNLADAISVPVERISVKARTNDGLGPDGEGRAASAITVVLLCEGAATARA